MYEKKDYNVREMNLLTKIEMFADDYLSLVGTFLCIFGLILFQYIKFILVLLVVVLGIALFLFSIYSHFMIERRSKYFFVVNDGSDYIIEKVRIIDFNEEEWNLKLTTKENYQKYMIKK